VLALIAALVASAGSLLLSLDIPPVKLGDQEIQLSRKLTACALCFYQRTFVFAALSVLLIGLFTRARRTGAIGVMALPLAVGGVAVAGFHVYLEYTKVLECPKGLLEIGTAPQQALAALAVLTLLLVIDSLRNMSGGSFGAFAFLLALILGGAMAYGCIESAPKLKPRDKPYDAETEPFNTCRPPYKAEGEAQN
jgi:disulfide bond formation protein DsbB